jgi:hypothetical protein
MSLNPFKNKVKTLNRSKNALLRILLTTHWKYPPYAIVAGLPQPICPSKPHYSTAAADLPHQRDTVDPRAV